MIGYFYDYVRNLIIFLVFMSFIQIIMPSTKYKSYINLVFGIMLVYIMVRPINQIYKNIENMTALNVFNDINKEEVKEDYKKYENIQNDMIKKAFNQNIKMQIENIIDDKYVIKDLKLSIYEDDYKELKIDKIELELIKSTDKVYIKPFNEPENIEKSKKEEIENIKKSISSFYILPKDNIHIKIA